MTTEEIKSLESIRYIAQLVVHLQDEKEIITAHVNQVKSLTDKQVSYMLDGCNALDKAAECFYKSLIPAK